MVDNFERVRVWHLSAKERGAVQCVTGGNQVTGSWRRRSKLEIDRRAISAIWAIHKSCAFYLIPFPPKFI